MTNFYNIIVLVLLTLLVTGAGVYITIFEQPKEIERLKSAEKVARLRQAEVTSLLAEENSSAQSAETVIRKWRSRYKTIPKKLTTADVAAYINSHTTKGFKNFDIALEGNNRTKDYQYYTMRLTGRGYFRDLYRFIWETENNRQFFRIRDLNLDHIDLVSEDPETGRSRLDVSVSFSMKLDAYYNGAKGLSADEGDTNDLSETGGLPLATSNSELPPVPTSALPKARPDINPFHPLILDQIPPNTYGLPNMDDAKLVSIVGGKAVFFWEGEYYDLGIGEPVYNGEISSIDQEAGIVVSRINKGGIIDEVEFELLTGETYKQALGPNRLSPIQSN